MVDVNVVGEVTKAAVEKCGWAWGFDHVSVLLPLAADLRKVASHPSTLSEELMQELGFHFAIHSFDDSFILPLVSSQKPRLEEADAFLDSFKRDPEVRARLVRDYNLDGYFSGLDPENHDLNLKRLAAGHVVGYPACCVRHHVLSYHSHDLERQMVPTSKWPESAKGYKNGVVPWIICSSTCQPSIEYAKKAIALYGRYLSLPEQLAVPTPRWDEERIQRHYLARTNPEAYPASTEDPQARIREVAGKVRAAGMGALARLKAEEER